MAKLSVIICVHNTNKDLLNKCLKSVFNSSLKDLEVIVIDDGSTIDYSEIISLYKTSVKYLKNEYKGILQSRIDGVKQTTADYICFIDGDDEVSYEYLEASVKKIEKSNCDIVINDWAFLTQNSRFCYLKDITINKNILYQDTGVLRKFFEQKGKINSFYVLWNKVYKREILLKACNKVENLNMSKLSFAENILLSFFIYLEANSVTNVHMGYYFYRTKNEKIENLDVQVDHTLQVFNVIREILLSINRFDELKYDFYDWLRFISFNQFTLAKKKKNKELKQKIKVSYKLKKWYNIHNVYLGYNLLPTNYYEVEDCLKKVYYSKKFLKIYAKRNSYTYKNLLVMKNLFCKRIELVKRKKYANIVMCKERYSLKQKLLHSSLFQKLCKKQSRIVVK